MDWAIALMASVLLTTIAAGLLTLVWIWVGKLLDKAGYVDILFEMLKVVQFFWLFPLVFFVLLYGSRNYAWWGGIMFVTTPLLQECAKYFCIVWLAGLAKGLYDYVKANMRLRQFDRRAFDCKASLIEMFEDVCDELHVNKKRVCLKQTYLTTTPFIAGGWKKTVYIPADASYSQDTFRIAFMHELTHYRQGAVPLKQFALLSGKMNFFNPLVRRYGDKVESWCEFACDYAVCRRLGDCKRYWLAIIETLAFKDLGLTNVAHMAEGGSLLVARLERMVKYPDVKRKPKAVAVLIACLMALTGTCSVAAASFGVANLYSELYGATSREYEEATVTKEIVTETADVELDDSYMTKTLKITADDEEDFFMDGYLYKNYHLDWEADGRTLVVSSEFEVESSAHISIQATINGDTDGEVAFGIIGPDGERRCVYAKYCGVAYDFDLDQPGTYRIYVRNCTEDALDGCFWFHYGF